MVGGTTTPAERNIISGKRGGVDIIGSNATNNQVNGSFLGTDVTGTFNIYRDEGRKRTLVNSQLRKIALTAGSTPEQECKQLTRFCSSFE